MPPKKKDKTKGSDWLQCSDCDRLICQADAEAHTGSCPDGNHSFILDKVLHGRFVLVGKLLDEDGSPVTKAVKDHTNTVWLSIPTMQMCGLSIGQPCVVNNRMVKRAWPAKQASATAVALTRETAEMLNVSDGCAVTVEKFQDSGDVAASVTLTVVQPNSLFETEEFSSFTAAYLDGKYIAEETPIQINYFGQLCSCLVQSMTNENSSLNQRDSSLVQTPKKDFSVSVQSTPVRGTPPNISLDVSANNASMEQQSPINNIQNTSAMSTCDDLSESMSSLNISNVSQNCTSSPDSNWRQFYPNLLTPAKSSSKNINCRHKAFAKVTKSTHFTVVCESDSGTEKTSQSVSSMSLEDLGGLREQVEELKARVNRAQQPSCSSRCVLLYGPPGVGKTSLARALVAYLGVTSTYVAGTDVWSKLFGEAESNLKRLFKQAKGRSPSILVLDDIDVLCPRHAQAGQQVHRILATLLALLDGCTADKNRPVVVLGITNNKDNMDPALLRAGRFGCEVEVGVPTALQRLQILKVLLKKFDHSLTETELQTVSRNAHGYVGADLAALVNEACMHASGKAENSDLPLTLSMEDFVYAGLHVKPSALREIQLDIPQVRWSDIGGMSEVKMRLREAVELPLSNPEIFQGLGIEPPRGLLMYGPPGCSKTMVARALATECKLNFLAVKGPELFNQYVGESEKAIREVFRKARSAAPSVIFFDEIDAIASKRGGSSGSSGVDDRVLTQLLTEMDGMESLKDVFVMAATNRPDKMDNALLRPGRFDSLVYVPLPDSDTRGEILEKKFAKMKVSKDVSIATLVEQTQNYSGAELIQLCQEAALYALRESLTAQEVARQHFDQALTKVQPQTDLELLEIYHKFAKSKS